tara:strand:- start:522 stop:965 length:444 start_codon:yes stop_codon:yes gene_type:complete
VSRKKTKRKIRVPRKPIASQPKLPSDNADMPLTPLTEALGMMQAGELDLALELVDQHIQANDADPFAHHLKGLILHRLEQFEEAVDAFAQSIELGEPQAAWHVNMGISQRAAGDRDSAIASFEKALELDAGCQPARYQQELMQDQDS